MKTRIIKGNTEVSTRERRRAGKKELVDTNVPRLSNSSESKPDGRSSTPTDGSVGATPEKETLSYSAPLSTPETADSSSASPKSLNASLEVATTGVANVDNNAQPRLRKRNSPNVRRTKGNGKRGNVTAAQVGQMANLYHGTRDALKEIKQAQTEGQETYEPEPYFPTTGLPLDTLYRALGSDAGERLGSWFGTGLWFNTWSLAGFLPEGLDPKLPDVFVSAAPPTNTANYWLGPTVYKCTEIQHDGSVIGVFDQRIQFYPLGLFLNMEGAWVPERQTDDLTLYVFHDGPCMRMPDLRVRFVTSHLTAPSRDMWSQLVPEDEEYKLFYLCCDTWGVRVSQARNLPYTLESARSAVMAANRTWLWARGRDYCPPELLAGMIYELQKDTRNTHKAAMDGGAYSDNAAYDLVRSLPSRLVNLTSIVYSLASKGINAIRPVAEDLLNSMKDTPFEEESTPFDDPPDCDDQSPEPDDSAEYSLVTIDLYGEGALYQDSQDPDPVENVLFKQVESSLVVRETQESLQAIWLDVTNPVSSYIHCGSSLASICTSIIPRSLGPFLLLNRTSWEQPEVFQIDKQNFKTSCVGTAMIPSYGLFGWKPQNFILLEGSYKTAGDVFQSQAYLKPRIGVTWKTPIRDGLMKTTDSTAKMCYMLWNWGFPLYKPQSSPEMTAMACVLRLGVKPAYEPLKRDKGSKLLAGLNIVDCLRLLGTYNKVTPLDTSPAFALPLFPRQMVILDSVSRAHVDFRRIMVADCKNKKRRLFQFEEIERLHDSLPVQTVFTKTDEYLFEAKPRVIHDSVPDAFWEWRSILQQMNHIFGSRRHWCANMGAGVFFTYGGCMTPLDKAEYRWKIDTQGCSTLDTNQFILVGGDDVHIAVYRKGVLCYEEEIDITKCDQSHTRISAFLFQAGLVRFFGASQQIDDFSQYVWSSMMCKNTHYNGVWLKTGVPETTWVNSMVIGMVACLSKVVGQVQFKDLDMERFFQAFGFDVKYSRVAPWRGTFHKGFWNPIGDRILWVPLPSRFAKFGTAVNDGAHSLFTHVQHVREVAFGWRSMPLEPIFGRMVWGRAEPLSEKLIIPDMGSAYGWQDAHRWDVPSPQLAAEDFLAFYSDRYRIGADELYELLEFIDKLPDEPLYCYNPSLQKIYVRDCCCDTQEDYELWLVRTV